jgi:hypothetical protein
VKGSVLHRHGRAQLLLEVQPSVGLMRCVERHVKENEREQRPAFVTPEAKEQSRQKGISNAQRRADVHEAKQ